MCRVRTLSGLKFGVTELGLRQDRVLSFRAKKQFGRAVRRIMPRRGTLQMLHQDGPDKVHDSGVHLLYDRPAIRLRQPQRTPVPKSKG